MRGIWLFFFAIIAASTIVSLVRFPDLAFFLVAFVFVFVAIAVRVYCSINHCQNFARSRSRSRSRRRLTCLSFSLIRVSCLCLAVPRVRFIYTYTVLNGYCDEVNENITSGRLILRIQTGQRVCICMVISQYHYYYHTSRLGERKLRVSAQRHSSERLHPHSETQFLTRDSLLMA